MDETGNCLFKGPMDYFYEYIEANLFNWKCLLHMIGFQIYTFLLSWNVQLIHGL